MKVDAFKNKENHFTGDLWLAQSSTDSTGNNVLTYNFARNISFTAVTGMFGKMTVYFKDSESDVFVNCRLENLRDASGNEMQPGFIWNIDQIAPNINIWGHREGFRGRITFFGTSGA